MQINRLKHREMDKSMIVRSLLFVGTVISAMTLPSLAISESLTIDVPNAQPYSKSVVSYQCADMDPFDVTYINAGPNSLAVLPVDGETLIFASVVSGSGARYSASFYEWWSHQGEATLSDVRKGKDAKPTTCKQVG